MIYDQYNDLLTSKNKEGVFYMCKALSLLPSSLTHKNFLSIPGYFLTLEKLNFCAICPELFSLKWPRML